MKRQVVYQDDLSRDGVSLMGINPWAAGSG
jgi:hypothetical protein